eukprot:5829278-Ditylum_brightwellii.AAC.1
MSLEQGASSMTSALNKSTNKEANELNGASSLCCVAGGGVLGKINFNVGGYGNKSSKTDLAYVRSLVVTSVIKRD